MKLIFNMKLTKLTLPTIAMLILASSSLADGVARRAKKVVTPVVKEVSSDLKDGVKYGSYPVRKTVGHPKVTLRFIGRVIGRVIY